MINHGFNHHQSYVQPMCITMNHHYQPMYSPLISHNQLCSSNMNHMFNHYEPLGTTFSTNKNHDSQLPTIVNHMFNHHQSYAQPLLSNITNHSCSIPEHIRLSHMVSQPISTIIIEHVNPYQPICSCPKIEQHIIQ